MIRIYFALLCLLNFSVQAQQYKFINYSVRDGLAATQARSMCQDRQGYLWIATLGGVSRFDGNSFTNYSVDDGLINNRNDVVFLDSKGQVWIGSRGGISKFKGSTFENYMVDTPLRDNFIITMAEDREGHLWLGTDRGGAFRFDGQSFTHFTGDSGLSDKSVRSIRTTRNGTVWFCIVGGLSAYQNGTFANTFTKSIIDTLNGYNISDLHEDPKGHIWVSTANSGLYRFDANLKKFDRFTTQNGLKDNSIESIFSDSEGNIWLSTLSGIVKYDGATFTHFGEKEGLPFERIKSMTQDNEGNLWLSSDGGGICKFTGEAFVNYTTADGICSNFVMSVVEDHENNIWFSTYGNGICKYDRKGRYENYSTGEGLSNNKVWCSMAAKDQAIWFGTTGGINAYKDGLLKPVKSINSLLDSLSDKKITALFENENGDLWLGNREGVVRWDGKQLTTYTKANGFPGVRIRSILKDSEGVFWFAGSNGLTRSENEEYRLFTQEDGLSDNLIWNILEDHKSNLWIGTDNGLGFYDRKTFQTFKLSETSRLFGSDKINFLVTDHKNRLWIGTNNGLIRLNLEEFYRTRKTDFKLFTDHDGINSPETNLNAAYCDKRGHVWMGTSEGTMEFDPQKEKITSGNVKPYINISQIRLFLEKTDWECHTDSIGLTGLPQNLALKHNHNYLTFYYRGIGHTNPKKIHYRFYLKGFEDTWRPLTQATFATYANLDYGAYTFLVRAQNKDGAWTSDPAAFSFTIIPPFWARWWFLALAVVCLGIITYRIYRWRRNVLRKEKEREYLINQSKMLALEQQTLNASMNRHFIFNALNSIQFYINRQDRLAANKYLSSFARLVRKNLDSSQTNVVSLSDEMERLELYLTLEHMRFHDKFEYRIKVDPQIDAEALKIPAMLLQPFVENSIWHGLLPRKNGGTITIEVMRKKNSLVFIIEDNGIGIETSLKKKKGKKDHISQGMAITTSRLRLMKQMTRETLHVKGPCELKDSDGKAAGTRVEIVLPVHYEELMYEKNTPTLASLQ